jgi:hypothetical protein
LKQKKIYKSNKVKLYALIWDQCAKAVQAMIASRRDFEAYIKNDPIELLKEIKLHAMNYQEYQLKMAIILDSMKTMLNLR